MITEISTGTIVLGLVLLSIVNILSVVFAVWTVGWAKGRQQRQLTKVFMDLVMKNTATDTSFEDIVKNFNEDNRDNKDGKK
jgi:type II secretory pathway component PulL